ncbi:unnamed protein product [Agarophyton chilense]
MASRVDQIALHVRKLAQATGVKANTGENEKEPSLDGVTSDLDIEALAKSLLDVSNDLDLYLQSLLHPPDLPIAVLKSDIAKLQQEVKEKDELLEKSLELVRKSESTFRHLKTRLIGHIYNM